MRRPKELRPVEWRQLCAIARELLMADPTIDDAEWKARIKERLCRLEFDYPAKFDTIPRAMSAVERALSAKWGPRPVGQPPRPAPVQPPRQEDPPWSHRRQPGAVTSIAALLANLRPSAPSETSSAISRSAQVNRHEDLADRDPRDDVRLRLGTPHREG
jgi:hypothetical protein